MKKIPDHAKLVFKGILHDTYQWQQELYDGSFATFEALYRRPGLTVIPTTKNNHIILNYEIQPNCKPFYTFPGGNSEDESFLEGAKREFLEETGYVSDEWREWFVSDALGYVNCQWENHFFLANNCYKIQESQPEPGEKIETRLISFKEFIEISQREDFRNSEIKEMVAKIKDDSIKLEEFRKLIFGE